MNVASHGGAGIEANQYAKLFSQLMERLEEYVND
jgi:hypothetical protein